MRMMGKAMRGFGELSEAVLVTTLGMVGDATLTRVSRTSAFGRYERAGYEIEDVTEIRALDVAVPDRIVGKACRAWTAVAGATGVATSGLGLVGMVTDIPSLLASNLMMIGEVATIYGFDVAEQDEHAYAIAVLFMQRRAPGAVARGRAGGRAGRVAGSVAPLQEIARELGAGANWEDVRDERAGRWLREAARELAWYLVKRKVAQVVPGVGTLVAGGVNAQFTARTCKAAKELYRERFVGAKPTA